MTRYRKATEADRIFIDYGWLDAYRWAHAAGMIHMDDWRDVMLPQIARVRSRPKTVTMVAEENGSPVGFMCAEPGDLPLVFFVYVKAPYRKAGYARGLFKAIGIDPQERFVYACKTPVVTEITQRYKIPCAKWDPYAARFDEYKPGRRDHEHR